MSRSPARAAEGIAWTLLAAGGFSAVSILTSLATRTGLSLSTVLAWRYVLASVVLLAWIAARPDGKRMPAAEVRRWLLVGGGGQALLVWLALSSLAYIPAATLAFLFYTYPAWVALVQAARGAERLDGSRGVALALSFGGIALMVGAPDAASLAWKGFALALGAAMVYALYIPTMEWLQRDWPVATTSAYAKVGSAVCFLVLALADHSFAWRLPADAWGAIAALTIFSTVLPSVFFLMGLLRLGPIRTSIISTVEPFMTAMLGVVVLAQPLTANTLVGGVLIMAAVLLLHRAARQGTPPTAEA